MKRSRTVMNIPELSLTKKCRSTPDFLAYLGRRGPGPRRALLSKCALNVDLTCAEDGDDEGGDEEHQEEDAMSEEGDQLSAGELSGCSSTSARGKIQRPKEEGEKEEGNGGFHSSAVPLRRRGGRLLWDDAYTTEGYDSSSAASEADVGLPLDGTSPINRGRLGPDDSTGTDTSATTRCFDAATGENLLALLQQMHIHKRERQSPLCPCSGGE